MAPLLEDLLTLDCMVAELACLISDPGAIRQPWHPDSLLPSSCGVPLFTCFVALQGIEPEMGPTRVLPGTQTAEWHSRLRDEGARGAKARKQIETMDVHMGAEAGDAFLMDSRVWHCGGSNNSHCRRRVLYISFHAPHCLPRGSTYSILDELQGQLRLRRILSGEDDNNILARRALCYLRDPHFDESESKSAREPMSETENVTP